MHVTGEAGRHVSRESCDQHNIVVHDYLGVDEDIVWQVVTRILAIWRLHLSDLAPLPPGRRV